MKVIYDFDRCYENRPDNYWAASKSGGFQFCFDESQTLTTIFVYVEPTEGFAQFVSECDICFASSIGEAECEGGERGLKIVKGKTSWQGRVREWIRLDGKRSSVHYEFRDGMLAMVTIMSAPMLEREGFLDREGE